MPALLLLGETADKRSLAQMRVELTHVICRDALIFLKLLRRPGSEAHRALAASRSIIVFGKQKLVKSLFSRRRKTARI
ncbi:MAG: hypothetical protein CR217_19485 [Beijerinckiaceae bacterium]|nr:MAG: hypothetical protein CR217_19485 [Beijerinckiaceae bacterium]